MTRPTTVVFDLGNVLIGWDPRALYRKLIEDERQIDWFLEHVCTSAWNLEQDRGRSFADGVALLIAQQPETRHAWIRAYHERWPEMLTGAIAGTLDVLERLHAAGTPLYALTNWNQDTFQHARERYAFLERFAGIVVSGEERLIKPDPAIYRTLCDRYQLAPEACVFIDDSLKNVDGARTAGMHGIHFRDPEQLRSALRTFGFDV